MLCAFLFLTLVYIYIKFRERNLKHKQEVLENKVAQRTAEVVEKAKEITLQKEIIEEKNKELTDAIHYAKRIQEAILPDKSSVGKSFGEYFVLFKPKDIVSGDFYWFAEHSENLLWAVVDCTGHGVPGGFMSMLGSGLLNQIVNEEKKFRPDTVLNELRDRVILALKQTGTIGENRDGMDISLFRLNKTTRTLEFAGANNSGYLVRKGELIELRADKQPIGIYVGEKKPFTLTTIHTMSGDMLYMTSDGYADQFGGPKGKKFKTANLEKLFTQLHTEACGDQNSVLEQTFRTWKGEYEQLDDVCIFGARV